jgi:hypothetical protein
MKSIERNLQRFKKLIERVWRNPYFGYAIWFASVALAIIFYFYIPLVGITAIIFGAVLALIPLRGELKDSQKFIFTILIVVLVFIESRSILQEHAAQERNFTNVLKETDDLLKTVTGGNSYPVVIPQLNTGLYRLSEGKRVPAVALVLVNRGEYPLTGLSIDFSNSWDAHTNYLWEVFRKPDLQFSSLPARQVIPMSFFIEPNWDAYSDSEYDIKISWLYGAVSEHLRLQPGKNGFKFAYSYQLMRTSPTQNILENTGWSDENGETLVLVRPLLTEVPSTADILH